MSNNVEKSSEEIDEAIQIPMNVQKEKLAEAQKRVLYYGQLMRKQLVTFYFFLI